MGASRMTGGSWMDAWKGNLRQKYTGGLETNVGAEKIRPESAAISLAAGEKFKVEMYMYHSVHNEIINNGLAFAKLLWRS